MYVDRRQALERPRELGQREALIAHLRAAWAGVLTRLAVERRDRRMRAELETLSDHMLADIGLTRVEARPVINSAALSLNLSCHSLCIPDFDAGMRSRKSRPPTTDAFARPWL
jgi:uncharacterized protein YjiS (DUF1127 family)